MRLPDGRHLYTAPCGIWSKWPSGSRNPLYFLEFIRSGCIWRHWYGVVPFLVQQVIEGDLSCDHICMKVNFVLNFYSVPKLDPPVFAPEIHRPPSPTFLRSAYPGPRTVLYSLLPVWADRRIPEIQLISMVLGLRCAVSDKPMTWSPGHPWFRDHQNSHFWLDARSNSRKLLLLT